MKPTHRPIVVVFVVFGAVMAVVGVSRWMAPKEIVPWRSDLSAARTEAQTSGRPVLAYFTADWCGPCHSMKSTTWADAGVEEALRRYVPVRIDVDLNSAAAMEYNAQVIPKFAVLDAAGNVVKSAEGYMDPQQFLAWLNG
ncbi:MAG TPA: thioredoxin family protein [Tepidisphaeraceae bacterium]|nr:thioredoxin family protein [Tepidisphaeraceae bacterium]